MANYRVMYYELFNAVTEATLEIHKGRAQQAEDILTKAQEQCEELFLEEPELKALPFVRKEPKATALQYRKVSVSL